MLSQKEAMNMGKDILLKLIERNAVDVHDNDAIKHKLVDCTLVVLAASEEIKAMGLCE